MSKNNKTYKKRGGNLSAETKKYREKYLKPCPEGKIKNPVTLNCVNKCKDGKIGAFTSRNNKLVFTCVNEKRKTSKKTSSSIIPYYLWKECPSGKERNYKTNRCVKKK